MNPSTALATVLVDELIRGGVREAVLAPGSRNAPLSFALHAADAAGRLRLHVRIDERSAGFLAVGLARASGRPVPVACTSGTAAANLHPAVIEARHTGTPILVLTADRPGELRGVGANQTIDQLKLYGDAVAMFHEVGAPTSAEEAPYWRSLICRALSAGGPVHLNLAFREPLVPEGFGALPVGRPDGGPWTRVVPDSVSPSSLRVPPQTLVIAGDGAGRVDVGGLPLIAEPTSGLWSGALTHGALLLGEESFVDRCTPDHVLVLGRPTLGRALGRLLRRGVPYTVIGPQWTDPQHAAIEVRRSISRVEVDVDDAWVAAWREADRVVCSAVASALEDAWPSGLRVARDVIPLLPTGAALVLGSSAPVRDVDLVGARREDLTILANRGAAGIDGTVSTAIGVALAHGGPTYAYLGDLTFLHDSNGLILGHDEPHPDLTIVVANNDGGGIFGLLEQGAPEYAGAFERVFGTPHGVDVGALCSASSTAYTLVDDPADLAGALAPAPGIRVVEVRTDRATDRRVHTTLRARIAEVLA